MAESMSSSVARSVSRSDVGSATFQLFDCMVKSTRLIQSPSWLLLFDMDLERSNSLPICTDGIPWLSSGIASES